MKSSFLCLLMFLLVAMFVSGCSTIHQIPASDNETSAIVESSDASIAVWPTTGNAIPVDVNDPFGPRLIPSGYDFHAGIDIKGAMGDPVYSVLSGVVASIEFDSGNTTAGNAVTIKHSSGVYTSYLHLSAIKVIQNQVISAGDRIGDMGNSGASYVHLHIGYFVGMPSSKRNEKYAKNPLEILPYNKTYTNQVKITDKKAEITINNDEMIITRWELSDGATSLSINYYDIVKQGSVDRNNQVQNSIKISVTDPTQNIFTLTLEAPFTVKNLKGYDFKNNLVFNVNI